MNNWDKLKLLMWKYSHFRKYYWIMTILEICLPILLVYLVIRISPAVIDTSEIPVSGNQQSERIPLDTYLQYSLILYTPPHGRFPEIMNFVKEGIRNATKKNVEIQSVKNENEMVLEISKPRENKNVSGIVFLELTNTFRYKIRHKSVYNTSEMFYENENERSGPVERPVELDPYEVTGFLGLMVILNQWYTEDVRSRSPFSVSKQQTLMGPFPYPAYLKVSPTRALLPLVLGYVIVITSLILCAPLLVAIISEKGSGLQELMKVVGVPEVLLWLSWFLNALAIGQIVYMAVTFLLRHDIFGTDVIVIRFVHGFVIWICLMLYYTAQIAFCFMFCAIFNSVILGTASLCVTTMTVSYLAYKFHEWHSVIFVHLSCFIPVGAFVQGFIRFAYYDMLGVPLSWRTLFSNEINTADASIGFVFVLLFFDIFLYLFLTYYIISINLGRSGLKKSPFFLFQQDSRKRRKNRANILPAEQETEVTEKSNPFIEPPATNTEVSIVLQDLQKNFGYVHAVKKVNLTLHKNEILVLLGHNGAGKTTTLSMMTGLIEPSGGQILFKGAIDLLRNMHEFRKNLGICFQEDRLFPYMTLMDHLIFFGMLKGATEEEATGEAKEYLQFMNLETNSDDLTAIVSKGMKRKLSLSIALMGKSDVLILDEPTASLDVVSKRKIWDLLLKLRENRTIILTSHFMKEAEVLGDRIAIMNQGLIVANGTISFLKRTFGTGYRLKILRKKETLTKVKTKDITPQIADTITKSIPGSRVEHRSPSELIFSLPSSETAKFPALIRGLDSKKSVLNIERVVVSASTLEQVYFKLGGESIYDAEGKLLKPSSVSEEPLELNRLEEKVVGLNLVLLQHQTLLIKKLLYLYRNARVFALRVVVPTILMLFLIRGTMKLDKIDPPLELTLQATYPNALVLILKNDDTNVDFYHTCLHYLQMVGARAKISEEKNITEALIKYANESISSYRRDIVMAFDFTRNSPFLKILYNRWARHSVAVLLTVIDNARLQYYTKNESFRIIPINHPIKPVNVTKIEDKFDTDISEQSPIITVWFILLAFFTIDLLDYFMIPVKVERIDGFKQIQLLSSVSLRTYWINNFVFDFILFFIIILIRMLLYKPFDFYGFFAFRHHMFIAILLIVLFIASGLLFMYVISFAATSKFGSYLFFFLFNLICTFISFTYYKFQTALFSGSPTSSIRHVILTTTKYTILLVPPLNFSLAFEKLLMNWRVNHMVEAYAQHSLSDKLFNATGYKYSPYLEDASVENPNGILLELRFLLIDIALYAAILYMIEQRIVVRYINSIRFPAPETQTPIPDPTTIPEDVLQERNKVDVLSRLVRADDTTENVLLVFGLKKIFGRLFRRPVTAVNDVTFVVKAGHCFVVLGPSGAGKTTTFKMLTGEVLPTQGESWILNVKLSENKTEYFNKVGYCAETNCFLEELTGKETLSIIASLRGVTLEDRDATVGKWLSILGLEPVENKKCGQYSGGDRRKICTALALIGDPNIVFLDEPTSGIDPVSRQRLYNVLIQTKSTGQAIALTSQRLKEVSQLGVTILCYSMEESDHIEQACQMLSSALQFYKQFLFPLDVRISRKEDALFKLNMEECEALCDRFTILVKGDMKFIGTMEELKKKYAQGFSLMIKLHEPTAEENEEARDELVQTLKQLISGKFKPDSCVLKEESKNLLRYQIKDTLPLADSFQKMEELRKDQKIIEEYLLTEISLDEVFHSFAQT